MKYYIVIGHKAGEKGEDCDSIRIVERDELYPDGHKVLSYLDINFDEEAQYGAHSTKTQEGWLIGRHRIAKVLDFGNFGYKFIRHEDTKKIQFPQKITLSFDKKIKDNGVKRPLDDKQLVDIEFTELNEQILNCYDKECTIDPIVFKLAKFDNYGDAYIDLREPNSFEDFNSHIKHFAHFMKNYPNSNVFLVCSNSPKVIGTPSQEAQIKDLLKKVINDEHLTNYFEFFDTNFKRRSPFSDSPLGGRFRESGTPYSEYDTFTDTIEQFFNEDAFNANPNSEKNFYNIPFKKAKITLNDNWGVYASSKKFKNFLQHNPAITLEIVGTIAQEDLIKFIKENAIKANIIVSDLLINSEIEKEIAANRQDDLKAAIEHYGYDKPPSIVEEDDNNEEFRLNLEKYAPQKLSLVDAQNLDANIQVGQNQNQNQNQAQQMRQSTNTSYEPPKLEINNKTSIPDVNFATKDELLKSLIGLPFQNNGNIPQTETNINHLFQVMKTIIDQSPALQNCYCPLSYSVEELVPGAFYVPKEKLDIIPPPGLEYTFDKQKNTLFFSPAYAPIGSKQNPYAYIPVKRPNDIIESDVLELNPEIIKNNDSFDELIGECTNKINPLLNNLFAKRGQRGIDLLIGSLLSLKTKNPEIYGPLIKHYVLTSNDFREYVDSPRYIATFEALAKLKDKKKINWWNKLLEIQCRNNPNFDVNHLFMQFTGFWEDLDKVQKFIPIPDEFPFDDFADAGVTLGKMYRIMIRARNRFEQIKSFEGGNISHAYMLYDLFNITMYSKEMDNYCALLTHQLKAEDAFDKSKLKETYFSSQKLAALSAEETITLDQLKSYLLVYAAVNGNTQKHNNSGLAFYTRVFNTLEEAIKDKDYSEADKKTLYSTIMLFAAYGNNTTKNRMVQDITDFINFPNHLQYCKDIWETYKDKKVSDYFSAQEVSGAMAHSEEIPSFYTIVTLFKQPIEHKEIISQATNIIIGNGSLSPAMQKIMRDRPNSFRLFKDVAYLAKQESDRANLIQSLFLISVALTHQQEMYNALDYSSFSELVPELKDSQLKYLNQLFVDIDFSTVTNPCRLFKGTNLSPEFISRVSSTQGQDDIIFLLQDFDVKVTTIEASREGLLEQIKVLEGNLGTDNNKELYVYNYKTLIKRELENALGTSHEPEPFISKILGQVTDSYSAQELKSSFEALNQIVTTNTRDDLIKIISVLEQFDHKDTHQTIALPPLLNITSLLMKHIYPVESIAKFLESIKGTPEKANAKLQFLQVIFEKLDNEAICFENNDVQKKLTKEVANHIKASMELMGVIDSVDTAIIRDGFQSTAIKIPQYLEFIAVLTSPTNFKNELVKTKFNEINKKLFKILEQYPDSFSDLLDVAKFDAELIDKLSLESRENLREELSLVAKICKNEVYLNSRKSGEPPENYKEECFQNIKILLDKKLDLKQFYSKQQLAHPSSDVLVKLLNHYSNDVNKALYHFEKDPWFKRPHKHPDAFGKNQADDKESVYQTGLFDTSKQSEALDQITSNNAGFEKSVRKNVIFAFFTYINQLGFSLPVFKHTIGSTQLKVPVIKLSDEELRAEFDHVKSKITSLRNHGEDNLWQDKKYQRAVCKLLAILREAADREGNKNAYSTQMDAVILALLAGDYQYAMQINTGEGKVLIAAVIAIALQTLSGKQVVVTTSNLSLAERDSELYDRLIQWFGISHAIISGTTKDKSKIHANIIHTTGNDFALCHGKDYIIDNAKRIYLNDESDYTLTHLMPAINSQSKPNEEENWWVYEEIYDYVSNLDEKEAKKKPELQTRGLIQKLIHKFDAKVVEIQAELATRLHHVDQNEDNETPEWQMIAKEKIEKECNERLHFYTKRITRLKTPQAEEQFNVLINSAIIAQFALKKGVGYEVINQLEEGKLFKRVVPTEGGKPIIEGDVLYMYGIHQFLIEKTIREYWKNGDNSEFLKPSELESTTYYNNYSIQAGAKSIGITGTVPKEKYKMYEAFIGGGRSDVIPPHNVSQRTDAVPYEHFNQIKKGNEHVCNTEEVLIEKLAGKIKAHEGPALIYCPNTNSCEARRETLLKQLGEGYTVQMIIPGVTAGFTDGDSLTPLGRQAQNQKTVTLTVGDGRGIDISPQGKDGTLTISAFAPETPEKLLQIYGRSGRNGRPGATDLYMLEGELTQYGIKFVTLDEQFEFLDKIRHKEFDFAIKKIGFMQYQVQNSIRDVVKKTEVITYMDDLYNKLLLTAVADKVKNKKENLIGEHTVSGKWEPFVMLNDDELTQIYEEFCGKVNEKLLSMQIYLAIDDIKNLQTQYSEQVKQAIEKEQLEQKGFDRDSIYEKLKKNSTKHESKLSHSALGATVKLADGMEIDIQDENVQKIYRTFALNIGRYDKTVDLMQKYVGTHLGVYGFINPSILEPYKQVYKLLDEQKTTINQYQKQETDKFYEYLICKESLKVIELLLSDLNDGSKTNSEAVEKYLTNAERYNNMSKIGKKSGDDRIVQIRVKALSYYKTGAPLSREFLTPFKDVLEQEVTRLESELETQEQTVIGQCQDVYQALQDKVLAQGAESLGKLAEIPLKEHDPKLAILSSLLQMLTPEEKSSKPVKKIITDIGNEVNPQIKKYNEVVQRYQDILTEQRDCLELFNKPHDIREKIGKYKSMETFDRVSSKNIVAFYQECNSAIERLSLLEADIKEEEQTLNKLKVEVGEVKVKVEEYNKKAEEYNTEVKQYTDILTQQRSCLEFLKKEHKVEEKINKHRSRELFEVGSIKNIAAFSIASKSAPDILSLKNDIEVEKETLEQLKKEENDERERERREQFLQEVHRKISLALNTLKTKIGDIRHPLKEAKAVANTLLDNLKKEQDSFLDKLKIALLEEIDLSTMDYKNHTKIVAINKDYLGRCESLINDPQTRAVLDRDLNWGPFLSNLLKTIANILIKIVTLGFKNNFFTLAKSEVGTILDEAKANDVLSPSVKKGT